jgi:hypothetical protein
MSKNMTRKGLALGAGVALVGTGFVAIPAQANTAELNLQPSVGTEFIVPSGNVFELKLSPKSGFTGVTAANLKYRITTDGTFAVESVANAAVASVDTYGETGGTTPNTGTTSAVVAAAVTNGIGHLGIAPVSADDDTTYVVNVQAWEDTDGDGVVDADEWNSDLVTVTFLKHSSVSVTASIVSANVTATTVAARFTSTINLAMLNRQGVFAADTAQFAAAFRDSGTAVIATGTAPFAIADDAVAKAVTYNAVDNRLEVTSPTLTALTAGDVVRAELWMLTNDTAANIADGARGDIDTADVATSFDAIAGGAAGLNTTTASTATALLVGGVNRTASAAPVTALGTVSAVTSATVANSGTGTVDAISDKGTVTAKVTVTPATGQSKSGIAVTWTVIEDGNNTLDAAAVVTAGGKDLKNTNGGSLQSITAITYTDAEGVALLVINYTGTEDLDAIKVDADVNEISATHATVTFKDNAAATARNVTAIGASAEYRVAVGSAFALRAGLADIFGNAINDASYTVTATDDSTSPRVITAALVNGVATLNMPSYATAQTRTITLQGKKNGVNSGSSTTVTVVVGAQGTPAQITLSGSINGGTGAGSFGVTTAIPLNTKTFTEVDTRVSGVAPSLDSHNIDVSALVLDAANAPISSDITFSGAGLDFVADGVYKKNEITVRGTGSGNQTVKIYSSVAGTKTLTVKAGTVTTTQKIYFGQPAADKATKITITAVDRVASGKALQVSGIVEDKFGNGVNATDFVVSYSGPGFYGSLPTTLTSGKFTFNVLMASNDTGTATITASVYTGADQISATKQVQVGAGADSVVIGSYSGRVAVRVEGQQGARLSVKIGNKWYVATVPSNRYVWSVKSRKGAVVKVDAYINGDLENTSTITVK